MKPYRDAVTRISIRQIRAQFAPKKFAALEEVLVKAGDASTVVKIARVPSTTAHGGMRRWLLCPRCGGQTSVVGLVSRSRREHELGLLRLRRLGIPADHQRTSGPAMKPNFVPHPYLAGEGRCRVCDLPYSTMIAKEVAVHRRFHGDYLRACTVGGAPMPESVRDAQARDGLAPQFDEKVPFKERLAGAEKWLESVFHGYLFGALYHQVEHRMDLREYFTKRVEGRDRLSVFQPDVVAALRLRYSDNFIG